MVFLFAAFQDRRWRSQIASLLPPLFLPQRLNERGDTNRMRRDDNIGYNEVIQPRHRLTGEQISQFNLVEGEKCIPLFTVFLYSFETPKKYSSLREDVGVTC